MSFCPIVELLPKLVNDVTQTIVSISDEFCTTFSGKPTPPSKRGWWEFCWRPQRIGHEALVKLSGRGTQFGHHWRGWTIIPASKSFKMNAQESVENFDTHHCALNNSDLELSKNIIFLLENFNIEKNKNCPLSWKMNGFWIQCSTMRVKPLCRLLWEWEEGVRLIF